MNSISVNSMTYTSSPNIRVSGNVSGTSDFSDMLTKLREKSNKIEGETFDDMYYHNSFEDLTYEELLVSTRSSREGKLHISLGESELPEFMDMVIEGMKNGRTLEEICDEQNIKASKRSPFLYNAERPENGAGSDECDVFIIDKDTGEVTYAAAKMRGNVRRHFDYEGYERDKKTVSKIADDLYTFLRYAAFPREEDDPERVERLFEHIKEKQSTYSVTRFMPCFNPSRDGSAQDYFIPEITAGEKAELEKDPIDEFMETLRIHQQKLSERNKNFSYAEVKGETDEAQSLFEKESLSIKAE